jgi:DNA-binding MarR family transcriptional regulator
MTNALNLDNQLCFALYSTSLAMTQEYKNYLTPLGMTYPQYVIMLVLWEKDGVSLKTIADKLDIKSGALTPVIKRMEVEGWLMRVRGEDDDRALSIQLTAKGKKLKSKAEDIHGCIANACGLNKKAISGLISQLTDLRENLIVNEK